MEASTAPSPAVTLAEREDAIRLMLEQQFETMAEALGPASQFGDELARAAEVLRNRRTLRAAARRAGHLRAVQMSILPLLAVPFL